MREMKDSGIEWIGFIPKDWNLNRIKYNFSLINGYSFDSKKYSDDGIRVVRISDVEDDYLSNKDIRYYPNSYINAVGESVIKNNDILVTLTGYLGKCLLVTNIEYGCMALNQRVGSLRRLNECKYDIRYMKYIIQCVTFRKSMELSSNGSAQLNMSGIWFINNTIPNPNLNQQIEIAYFLDQKCSEIDAITSDIEKQISTLEEYKKSIVYNSICKGLKNSRMKKVNSDVWKEIPENWDFKDVKYVFEIVKRIAGKEGYDVISVTQTGLKYKDITSGDGQLAKDYSGYQFVYPTDYVMNHMDLLTGWVDCSTLFGVTSPDYRVFRLRNKATNNLDYFKYLMQSCYMSRIFYSLGYGVSTLGRWRLQAESFNNFMIPVPPLEEQEEIAEYLNEKINNVNELIKEKEKELEILAEYKKSLIYEYVTGKKEVEN